MILQCSVANALSWLAREHETQWAGEEGDVQVYWKQSEIRARVLVVINNGVQWVYFG